MTPEKKLRQSAADIATRLEHRAAHLQRELDEIETRKTDIQVQRDAARLAPKRLADYPVMVGLDFACPRCWMERGKTSVMDCVNADDATHFDSWLCPECGFNFEVPA